MNIRTKLILLFVSIVALISAVSSVAIYFFSANYRKDDFYRRMENKARITTRLLLEVDEVDENVLRRIEKDNPTALANERIIIYDFRDEILYSSDISKSLSISGDLLDQIRLDGTVRFKHDESEVLGFLYSERYDRVVVIVSATDVDGLNRLKNLRAVLLVVFLTGIGIILVSATLYVRKVLQPISRVIREVGDISARSLHLRLAEGNGKDELARLAKTFNSMLTRLESSFTGQRQFIANASHELRNPLTAILGQIDVALIDQKDGTHFKGVLRSIKEDMLNLKNVSNRLLLLAQASIEQPDQHFSPQRVDQLLWDAKSDLEKYCPQYSVSLELDPQIFDDAHLIVQADEQLLKGAFVNVMENGCKYSSSRTVSVRVKPHGALINLVFADHGIGIPPEDLPYIFEPFYRGKNSDGERGAGIGLSLVQRIVRSHRGTIEVRSAHQEGTLVSISLPVVGETPHH